MNKSWKIMSIEAKDLINAMNQVEESNREYKIRNKDGQINTRKFSAVYDYSLDAIKLRETYERRIRRKDFAFKVGKHWYTKNVICVTFKYSYKNYNLAGKNTYILNGYSYKDCNFVDGASIKDGILIGIQTNVSVENPVSESLLGDYFRFNGEYYEQAKPFTTIMDKSELRNYLYQNGFKCDGTEYVRYKRSSGSSRVGKCLFVNKDLAKDMEKWDKCGLPIKDGDPVDLAGYEAYISLPMSSIIDTIDIPLESILVIKDYESEFYDDVVSVWIEDNHLVSGRKKEKISNSIWDGQSLLDSSMFGKYSEKGMILLRNQFFKSCCFNTNISEFFKDNGITSVDQLNGYTLATDVSQIKMITTPSSIKYLKYSTIDKWFANISPTFGVVKYEKPPKFFDGDLVQSHYQLLNTLHLSYDEMEQILAPSLKYIKDVRRDPAVLRYEIRYPDECYDEISSLKSKNEIIFKMLGINDKFAKTKLYYDFRDDLIKGEMRNLKQGHVLINGNYSTMMGNGYEMLNAAVGRFDGESAIGYGNIHSTRFSYGSTILASRSPHVTVGNIWLVKNVECDVIDKYFNLTKNIVCVNAINENIQQRLNGCDYDSDTVLLTDNGLMIEAATRHYGDFPVPTNMTTASKIQRYYTVEHKAYLDIKTSVNKIGEIINLSQQLNSLMWDNINHGATIESCEDLYNDICKLAVLSNVEIDRAKREFVINSGTEIRILKEKYKITDDEKTVKPKFFKTICIENGYQLSDRISYKEFDTSMDYLQKILSRFNFRESRECKRDVIPFMDLVKRPGGNVRQGYYYSKKDNIISIIRKSKNDVKALYVDYESKTPDDKLIIQKQAAEMKQACVDEIDKLSECAPVMYLTLKELDNKECRDVYRYIFEVIFGKPNESFFKMIQDSRDDIYTLERDDDGDIEYYGLKFKKKPIKTESLYGSNEDIPVDTECF